MRGEPSDLARSPSTWMASRLSIAASMRWLARSRRAIRCRMARSLRGSACPARHGRLVRRSDEIRFRSSCPAIACSLRVASSEVSPRTAVSAPSSGCWRSKARAISADGSRPREGREARPRCRRGDRALARFGPCDGAPHRREWARFACAGRRPRPCSARSPKPSCTSSSPARPRRPSSRESARSFRITRDGLVARRVLRASDEKLRGAGLSRSKVLSLRDLALRVEAGEIPTLAGGEAHGRR